jgi:hypothetical protein
MDGMLNELAAMHERAVRDEVTRFRLAACLRALRRRHATHRRAMPS